MTIILLILLALPVMCVVPGTRSLFLSGLSAIAKCFDFVIQMSTFSSACTKRLLIGHGLHMSIAVCTVNDLSDRCEY